jgi:NTE family protein
MVKRALVLSGGGARGAFQVGMLRELVINRGLDFQVIRGVSVGSLNAAYLAQASTQGDSLANLAQQVERLEAVWRDEIQGNSSVYKKRWGVAGVALGADSLYSLGPLRALIEKSVDVEAIKTSGRDFAVGTVSLISGRYGEWSADAEHFLERLVASSSIPVIFPLVRLEREQEVLVDGGVRNITPLSSAFRAQPDELYVLLASRMVREGNSMPDSAAEAHPYQQWEDNWLGTRVSAIDVLKRTVDLLSDEAYLDDLRTALRWNRVIECVEQVIEAGTGDEARSAAVSEAADRCQTVLKDVRKRRVQIFVIAPRQWFNEEAREGERNSAVDFNPELIRRAIQHGQQVAADPHLWLWPPT